MGIVIDTNLLLNNPDVIDLYDNVVILSHVMHELEIHKVSTKRDLAYSSRQVTRKLKHNKEKVKFDLKEYRFKNLNPNEYDDRYEDNYILEACLQSGYALATGDMLLQMKAEGLGIEIVDVEDNTENLDRSYSGYKEVFMTTKELHDVYEHLDFNQWDLHLNEYLIVKDGISGEDIDAFKWDGNYLHRVNPKGFTTSMFGKFKPYDHYQKIAVDSILNNQLTSLKGKAGSGKSLIALNTAWHLIERQKYDRLIIFSNPSKVRNAESLGFYKGSRTDKLLDSQLGIMLGSKFGDEMAVQMHINNGKMMLIPFSDIRGFDTTSEQKTIVWITEAQNLNVDLLRLGLQRIGDNTKVIVDGDPNTQVDMDIYRTNNGMLRMSEVYRGDQVYGEVELKKIYRSRIAELADKM